MSATAYDWIRLAENQVLKTYGDRVSVIEKGKSLLKFGRTEEVTTTSRTVAQLGAGVSHETYLTTNGITHASSSNDSDEQDVHLEYHLVSNGGLTFTFGIQEFALTGQTAVALPVPCGRTSRLFNEDGTNFNGTIYVFENDTLTDGVPDTPAKVHITVPSGKNQSFKTATTISDSDYYFITQVFASVNRKLDADVDVEIEIRNAGKVFRQIFPISVATDGTTSVPPTDIRPFLIIPRNADVRMTATAVSGSGIAVSGGFNGLLAAVLE